MNRKILRFIGLASLVITAWILGRISGIHGVKQKNATANPIRKSDSIRDSLVLRDLLHKQNANDQDQHVGLENKE
jgi:hypothetical protein